MTQPPTPKPPADKPTNRAKYRAVRAGRWAERAALVWYCLRGYRPVARNVRLPVGEIDLIVRRRQLLVFVEVKYRARPMPVGASVAPRQWRRISAAATAYIGRRPDLQNCRWRFDQMLFGPGQWPVWRKNVWRAGD